MLERRSRECLGQCPVQLRKILEALVLSKDIGAAHSADKTLFHLCRKLFVWYLTGLATVLGDRTEMRVVSRRAREVLPTPLGGMEMPRHG